MTDNPSKHWDFLAQELGADAAPHPAKPAPPPPPPAVKKKPPVPTVAPKPQSNWEDVAALLGVDAPPRPPKPAPPPKPPRPVKPVPEVSDAGEIPPPAAEVPRRDVARREGGPHEGARGGDRRERGGRREGRGDRGRREHGERRPRREGREERPRSAAEHERFGDLPADELLADEMVSADFVDDLVEAEDQMERDELAGEVRAPRRSDDEEPRRGRRRRRRGGRRGREPSETAPQGESRAFDDEERTPESEHIEEIVDAIEASPIAEPDEREPLEEAVAAEDMGWPESEERRRGKRRRRRRGRRSDSERPAGNEAPEHAEAEPLEAHSDEAEEDPDLDADLDLDEEGDGHDLRPSHRAIPSWEEAIGMIVSGNMEARAKNPHAGGPPRGRGRGPRGRGGRRP
ncbi:MAG TPA: hypothetical protein PK867_09950 [Pirellulales bacterium]|nr:hypothetical protein [Pirellulales bacterium]